MTRHGFNHAERDVGTDGPTRPREPTYLEWKQWGSENTVEFEFPDDSERLINFGQTLLAGFHHPVGWLVAFNLTGNTGGTVPDIAKFFAVVTYGLGRGRFRSLVQVGTLSPVSPGPLVVTVGPTPAETIQVEGSALVTPSGAIFPKRSTFTFGAFAAPQVWP